MTTSVQMREYQRAHYTKNKSKYLAAAKRYTDKKKAADPRYYSAKHLQRTYNMSLAEYDAQVEAQNGLCAICGRPPNGRFKKLVVDHNHGSGKRRGLLCNACNRGIGYLGEDVTRLRAAAIYIERYLNKDLL